MFLCLFVGIHTPIQVVGSEQNNEIAEISLFWGLAGLSLTGWVICLAIWKGFTAPDWLGWLLDASLVRHFGTNGCVILWIMEWNQNTKLRKCKLTGPQLPEGSDPDLCCCACAQKYNNCYFFFFSVIFGNKSISQPFCQRFLDHAHRCSFDCWGFPPEYFMNTIFTLQTWIALKKFINITPLIVTATFADANVSLTSLMALH